jgi:choline transport protein
MALSNQPTSDSEKGTMTDKDPDPGLMEVNETGHMQELERNFSLFSICSVGIVTGNTWAALGGSIVVAIYNGGPPGVLYEFIAVSIFYWLVAASLAVSPLIYRLHATLISCRSSLLPCQVVLESITGPQ